MLCPVIANDSLQAPTSLQHYMLVLTTISVVVKTKTTRGTGFSRITSDKLTNLSSRSYYTLSVGPGYCLVPTTCLLTTRTKRNIIW